MYKHKESVINASTKISKKNSLSSASLQSKKKYLSLRINVCVTTKIAVVSE